MTSPDRRIGTLDIEPMLLGIADPARELIVSDPVWDRQLSFLGLPERDGVPTRMTASEADLIAYDWHGWDSTIDLLTRLTACAAMRELGTPVPLNVGTLSGGRSGPTLLMDFGDRKEVMKIYRHKSAHNLIRSHLLAELVAPRLDVAIPIARNTPDGLHSILTTGKDAVAMYRWLPGQPLGSLDCPSNALWTSVGSALGRLHASLRDVKGLTDTDGPEPEPTVPGRSSIVGRIRYFNEKLVVEGCDDAEARESLNERSDLLRFAEMPQPHPVKNIQVIHGDLHAYNIVVENDSLTGFIDWEHATLGDPMMELARLALQTAGSETIPNVEKVRHLLDGYRSEVSMSLESFQQGLLAYWWFRVGDLRAVDCRIRCCSHSAQDLLLPEWAMWLPANLDPFMSALRRR